MSKIETRSEILFLYDIENANPNGDPNDENKPRIDEETGINLVTDVRLKRTVRDYMLENGNDIFVQEKVYDDQGHIQDAKLRAADYLPEDKSKIEEMDAETQRRSISENILKSCIDVRLFGATIPLELKVKKDKSSSNVTSSITFTGPVQFKMGKSLHATKIMHIKGTGAFASKKDTTQKTFREEYFLPYSLIGFYGVVNENAASHTKLMNEDIDLLKKAMWNGTKGLISRSKFGQMPRLLLKINYNCKDFFIGELDNLISLVSGKEGVQIRKPEDYEIDLTDFLKKVDENKSKIKNIEFVVDEKMRFLNKGEAITLNQLDKFEDNFSEVI